MYAENIEHSRRFLARRLKALHTKRPMHHPAGYHFRKFLPLALILCVLAVVIAAILARSSIKLRGALTSERPSALTVITLLQEKFEGATITNVEDLPGRESDTVFDFTADIDGQPYLVSIDEQGPPWKLKNVEKLHGDPESL